MGSREEGGGARRRVFNFGFVIPAERELSCAEFYQFGFCIIPIILIPTTLMMRLAAHEMSYE